MATNARWRLNPFTNLYTYETINNESQTVALIDELGIYGFYLNEAPRIRTDTDSLTVVEDITGGATWAELNPSIAPSAGEYRVDETFSTGLLEFNNADNGKTFNVSYQGKGSTVKNDLELRLDALEATTWEVTTTEAVTFGVTGTTETDVTGLSEDITTYGEPVYISMVTDNIISGYIRVIDGTTVGDVSGTIHIYRDSTKIHISDILIDVGSTADKKMYIPLSSINVIDHPPAGTYTYKVTMNADLATTTIQITQGKMRIVVCPTFAQ